MGIGMEFTGVRADVVSRIGQPNGATRCPETALMRAWCQSDKQVMKSRRRALKLLSAMGDPRYLALRLMNQS